LWDAREDGGGRLAHTGSSGGIGDPGQEGACLPGRVSEDSMVAEKLLLTAMAGSGPALGNGRP